MFNNRMLAVAAVLVMAVPALGAATPIVVPPVPEQLVEGHTVFTVIEIVKATRTTESRFAAAVAVLVREYVADQRARRFPGVLWFNDQYLVNPTQSRAAAEYFRYPCGGAVIAVNAGDPDPRMAIARVHNPAVEDPTSPGDFILEEGNTTFGTTEYTYESSDNWVKPYPDPNGDGTDDPYYYGQDSGGPGDARTDYAWIGVNGTNPADPVYSDTTVGAIGGDVDKQAFNMSAPWDYDESYLVTDPNDHSWVIDKYKFYTRDSVAQQQNVDNIVDAKGVEAFGPRFGGTSSAPYSEHSPTDTWGGQLATQYEFPVWVVNILGSPAFVPDEGNEFINVGEPIGENCMPFRDLLEDLTAPANGAACGASVDNGNLLGTGSDSDLTLSPGSPVMPFTDDPCMGYMEPSRNGYCYGGQSAEDTELDGDIDKEDCLASRDTKPLRLYNALLYFKLEDLRVAGANKDHSDPVNNVDTNGCSEEQYWWGPNPPRAADDWPCPGDDDNAEGNSHSFHPSAPVHEEREACIPEFGGPNPTNHGGSTYISVDDRAGDDGWYDKWTPCDYAHATRNIDIYFSGAGRPFPPVVRTFDVMDLEGSSAPFQDFHSAYPGVSP